jgi:Zn-dependent protease with chaperone function
MDFLLRCLVLTLAAFGATYALASAAVTLRWLVAARPAGPDAGRRADRLFRLRLAPAVIAAAVLAFAAIGLYRFESRQTDEVIGVVLWASACFGAACLGSAAWRLVAAHRSTRRLMGRWLAEAEPIRLGGVPLPAYRIHTGFPVVAVVGIFRPRLVIDALVLDGCTTDELHAILSHERSHIRRWDNLRRLAFAALPAPWASGLQEAWIDATEEAADDLAVCGNADARVHLASALVRVARMASSGPTRWQSQLPASALYRGDDVAHRVRRLIGRPAAAGRAVGRWPGLLLATASVIAFAWQRELHDVMERVVAVLP